VVRNTGRGQTARATGNIKQGGKIMIKRGDVYWINLDPTQGSEVRNTRPCLVVSPDDMNAALPRVIVAPLTSAGQPLGCRPVVRFKRKAARILLDQLRSVDKKRLGKKMGTIGAEVWHATLLEMFG
jgi:mRNA interferase MazF